MVEVNWLTQAEFSNYFEVHLRPNNRLLRLDCWFSSTPQKVISAIDSTPVDTPAEEDDFPGPTLRWYGEVNKHHFLLDMPSDEPADMEVWPIFHAEPAALDSLSELTLDLFGTTIIDSHVTS